MRNTLIGIAVGAVLVLSGIFAARYLIDKNSNISHPSDNNNPSNVSNTGDNANKPIAASTDVSIGNNTNKFTSPTLGISFTYLKEQNGVTIATKEVGKKVYVYMTNTQPETGQYLEVFPKDKTVTLENAIKADFLSGYSATNCLVKPSTHGKKYPISFQTLEITVPVNPGDGMPELSEKWDKCPQVYTSTNGVSYFLGDTTHPDTYVYLSIGQYGISAPGPQGTGWQDTLEFL